MIWGDFRSYKIVLPSIECTMRLSFCSSRHRRSVRSSSMILTLGATCRLGVRTTARGTVGTWGESATCIWAAWTGVGAGAGAGGVGGTSTVAGRRDGRRGAGGDGGGGGFFLAAFFFAGDLRGCLGGLGNGCDLPLRFGYLLPTSSSSEVSSSGAEFVLLTQSWKLEATYSTIIENQPSKCNFLFGAGVKITHLRLDRSETLFVLPIWWIQCP